MGLEAVVTSGPQALTTPPYTGVTGGAKASLDRVLQKEYGKLLSSVGGVSQQASLGPSDGKCSESNAVSNLPSPCLSNRATASSTSMCRGDLTLALAGPDLAHAPNRGGRVQAASAVSAGLRGAAPGCGHAQPRESADGEGSELAGSASWARAWPSQALGVSG